MIAVSSEDRSKLHIAVLDPVFRRDDQPGSTRTYDLARRLVQVFVEPRRERYGRIET